MTPDSVRIVGHSEVTPRSRRLDANLIVDRSPDALFAAEIALGSLYRNVPQQELDLLQFATGRVAQSSAGPSKIIGVRVCRALLSLRIAVQRARPPSLKLRIPIPYPPCSRV